MIDSISSGFDSAVSSAVATNNGDDSFDVNKLFFDRNVKNEAAAILLHPSAKG